MQPRSAATASAAALVAAPEAAAPLVAVRSNVPAVPGVLVAGVLSAARLLYDKRERAPVPAAVAGVLRPAPLAGVCRPAASSRARLYRRKRVVTVYDEQPGTDATCIVDGADATGSGHTTESCPIEPLSGDEPLPMLPVGGARGDGGGISPAPTCCCCCCLSRRCRSAVFSTSAATGVPGRTPAGGGLPGPLTILLPAAAAAAAAASPSASSACGPAEVAAPAVGAPAAAALFCCCLASSACLMSYRISLASCNTHNTRDEWNFHPRLHAAKAGLPCGGMPFVTVCIVGVVFHCDPGVSSFMKHQINSR
jgi:hypothetical protein